MYQLSWTEPWLELEGQSPKVGLVVKLGQNPGSQRPESSKPQ